MAAGDWKDLLKAIEEENLELVKYHIQSGVNINYQHPEFLTTPLIESITAGNLAIIELLLASGADPLLQAGFSTDTPLVVAKRKGNKAIVDLLHQYLPQPTGLWARLKVQLGF